MSVWQDDTSAINHYYDSDFPSEAFCRFPENFDETTVSQGLRFDVPRYVELASDAGGPVLEACCGTGRVALPLARAGFDVVGVDYSPELLRQFAAKIAAYASDLRERIRVEEQDITQMSLGRRDFPLAILAFNSLLCLPDFEAQCRALVAIGAHVRAGGLLLVDIVNPLRLPLEGDAVPKPFFTRRNPHTGRRYTRFATWGPFDAAHRQELRGWYDELDDGGVVTRRTYSVTWRPIFRYEIELMLRTAGFEIDRIEGGHRGEPYDVTSPRMFVQARRVEP